MDEKVKLVDATLEKTIKPEDVKKRLIILASITVVVFVVLISRLWFMQVIGGQKYVELAEGNYVRVIPIDAPRGVIYDRNGNVLVNNRPSIGVALSPQVVEKHPEIIPKLSKILGIPVSKIEEKLTERKADPLKPRVIMMDVGDQALAYIEEHNMELPGVDVVTESIRAYSYGTLGAHILGYLGEISEEEMKSLKGSGDYMLGDIVGKTGVENVYEGLLRGQKGNQQLEVNAVGRPLGVIKTQDPIPGHNLMLTIDLGIQQVAEQALEEAIESARNQPKDKTKADGAAAVVIDPQNGEILAMASYPTYNPEVFVGGISKENWKQLIDKKNNYPLNNRAVMAFPPGSTFKPVTLIGAMADGLVGRGEKFVCTGKWTGLGKKWAKFCWDHSGHGKVGLSRAIAESCDTVFYILGYRFYKQTKERLQYWSRIFGFGVQTGVDLPTEMKGRIPDKKWKKWFNRNNGVDYQRWYPGDTINMAIGQGDLLVTPLQLASFYAAIANGGTIYRPHLGKAMISWDGKVRRDFKPKPEDKRELPISKDIIRFTQLALEKVTTEGTAKGAFYGFPVSVAGKTGTAQVKKKDDYAWFVGYAPADNPKYLAVVMVEQGGHGGTIAAPAVRKILAAALGIDDKGTGYVYDPSR
ncbi:MAG: penicillin-binding protein 2 [Actinomycetota bacterium]|nr:penicillin-binding protein 2 [Actinomycetota bacterium]